MLVSFEHGASRYQFKHPPGDHIGRCQAGAQGFYEADLLAALQQRLTSREGLVVDVGAHVGNHAIYFAAECGRQVLALEPNPESLRLLVRNAAIAGVSDRITVVGCAASERCGACRVIEGPEGNSGMASAVPDPSGTRLALALDALVEVAQVALLKIDVEGAELEVLRGASVTLLRCRPLLSLEAATPDALEEQRRLLEPLGYETDGRRYGYTPTHIWERLP